MLSVSHIVETALLFIAAYLVGCTLGYAARWVLHAERERRTVSIVDPPVAVPAAVPPAPTSPRRPKTNAARLAAAADEPALALPSTAIVPIALPPPPAKPRKARTTKPAKGDPKPAALTAPRQGQADNLKQIKGIGPKIEASLHAFGIFHFDQIAAWTPANIDWVDGQLAFKGRIRREHWVEQARELAALKV